MDSKITHALSGINVNNKISTITESGTNRVVKYFYDSLGRLNQVTDPEGGNSYYGYDSAVADAFLSQVINNGNLVVEQFWYHIQQGSDRKRIQKIQWPTGNEETYTY
ncbi:MAG: hypothetical protein FWH52_06440, partial [Synergistaceae bacterium]|nr:hypothetical protein [Synergistaceae bacterium]